MIKDTFDHFTDLEEALRTVKGTVAVLRRLSSVAKTQIFSHSSASNFPRVMIAPNAAFEALFNARRQRPDNPEQN
jgi:5-methylcytosine-specific restriction endonuclease McrBC regulatory subunit McrC